MPWLLFLAVGAIAVLVAKAGGKAAPLAPRPSPSPSQGAREGLAASASSSDDNYAGKKDGYWVLSAKGAELVRRALYPRSAHSMGKFIGGAPFADLWMAMDQPIAEDPKVAEVAASAFKSDLAVVLQRHFLDEQIFNSPLTVTSVPFTVMNPSDVAGFISLSGYDVVRIFP